MRYLTKQTLKDILEESGVHKEILLNLKYSILNSITNLDTLLDDGNKTYIDSFIPGGYTNTMTVDVDYMDDIVFILNEIGFKEEEIMIEDTPGSNHTKVNIYCLTNRHDHIRRLISYGIITRVETKVFNLTLDGSISTETGV